MGMREGLRIFFRRWRAAAPGQQQESFLALLLMLVALGILCAERLAPPAPLCALLCVCALLLGAFLVWRQRPSAARNRKPPSAKKSTASASHADGRCRQTRNTPAILMRYQS